MKITLLIRTHLGEICKTTLTIDHGPILIGRAANLPLGDDHCSRRHCEIYAFQGDKILLRDLGSKNGTYVNEERVTCVSLKFGDTIRVGRTDLALLLEDREMQWIPDYAPSPSPSSNETNPDSGIRKAELKKRGERGDRWAMSPE